MPDGISGASSVRTIHRELALSFQAHVRTLQNDQAYESNIDASSNVITPAHRWGPRTVRISLSALRVSSAQARVPYGTKRSAHA